MHLEPHGRAQCRDAECRNLQMYGPMLAIQALEHAEDHPKYMHWKRHILSGLNLSQ